MMIVINQINKGVNIMSLVNTIKILLELEEDNLEIDPNFEPGFVKLKNNVTAKLIHYRTTTEFVICSCCGQLVSKLHDYRVTRAKHYLCGQQPLVISIKKKRFHCDDCNVNITENIKDIEKNCFISNALKRSIAYSLKKTSSLKQIAIDQNVSYTSIYRSLNKVSYVSRPSYLPEVLSFDEFRANTADGKYAFIVVDPIGKKILEILPDRKFDSVYKYFQMFSKAIRKRVKYVVSDLWKPYKSIIKLLFPNALMVADKFHYQRVMAQSVGQIRKRISKNFDDKTAYQVKKYWRLLQANIEKIDDKNRRFSYLLKRPATDYEILCFILNLNEELCEAYYLYQNLLNLLGKESEKLQTKLFEHWLNEASRSEVAEILSVSKTMKTWKHEIQASFIRYNGSCMNNAFIEGINNKIKVIKRVSYGYRSFINFRKRIFLVFY